MTREIIARVIYLGTIRLSISNSSLQLHKRPNPSVASPRQGLSEHSDFKLSCWSLVEAPHCHILAARGVKSLQLLATLVRVRDCL